MTDCIQGWGTTQKFITGFCANPTVAMEVSGGQTLQTLPVVASILDLLPHSGFYPGALSFSSGK